MGAFLINNPKCVFIHIPKTAGFAIREGTFKGNYQGPKFVDLPEDWKKYFSFTFVRNPYDRLVSAWKMFTNGMEKTDWAYNQKLPLNGITFYDFLKIATDDNIEYHTRKDIYSVLRHHTLPQTHPYHCFSYAKFIGRFENLQSDFEEIAKIIGLNDFNLNKLNTTKRKPYDTYYEDNTFDIVTQYYKEDLERFNYSF